MESVGARLRSTRESKGYTLEQIARDTHIAKRFLEALESEDFDAFPGEPYLIGFMRTYSTYLGLEEDETISLYHNIKIQEQPPPIDELINKNPPLPIGRILIIVAAVVLVGGGLYLGIASGIFSGNGEAEPAPDAANGPESIPPPSGELFDMTDEIVEQRFAVGDRIVVPVLEASYPVDLAGVGDGLELLVDGEEIVVAVGSERVLDLDEDGTSDLRIIVRSVDQLDSPATVVMRLDRGTAAAATAPVADPVGEAVEAPAVGSTREPTREEQARLIAAFDERDEFTVDVRFEGYALFRYELDDEDRVEQYFQAGDTIRVTVRDELKIWASNAASPRLRIAGTDISLGDPGEVTAGLITWVSDPESDRELLELLPVY